MMKHFFTCLFYGCFLSASLSAQLQLIDFPKTSLEGAAVATDTLAFFGGGFRNGAVRVDDVTIYNANTETFTFAKLSEARNLVGAATASGKVIFAGGQGVFEFRGSHDRADIYDIATNTWTTDTLSSARGAIMAIGKGDSIYFAGGFSSPSGLLEISATKTIDIYNVRTGEWTKDSLSEARGAGAVVSIGPLIIFAGGIKNNDEVSKRVDIYNTVTKTWAMDSLSLARKFLAGASDGEKAFFAGGSDNENNSAIFSRVDIYDPTTMSWSTNELSAPREGLTAAYACGKIVFAGGGRVDWSQRFIVAESTRVDLFDVDSGEWTTQDMANKRFAPLTAAIDNEVIIASGFSSTGGALPSAEVLTCPDPVSITSATNHDHKLSVFPNPVLAGTSMRVNKIPLNTGELVYRLVDFSGREVAAGLLSVNGELKLKSSVKIGSYLLLVSTKRGDLFGRAKVFVK